MMSRCSASMPRVARGYPLPGASVPRPDGHGTGGFPLLSGVAVILRHPPAL
ncbi:hypothetical protein ACMDLT_004403 [Salmonella enterica]